MLKKIFVVFMSFVLLSSLGGVALGEENADLSFDIFGVVAPKNSFSILATGGGILEDFSLRVGNSVGEGDLLFTLITQKTYAPWDGTVRGVTLSIGDDLAQTTARYGAPFYIEPSQPFLVESSTAQAYNENDNKIIHIGEKVYLLSSSTKDRTGLGIVIAVEGSSYRVEVLEGNLHVGERIGIYRNSDHDGKSRIGYGITASSSPVAVEGSGTLVALHVKEGQQVQKGELLFETLLSGGYGSPPTSSQILSPVEGVITSIAATGGTLINADQLLATVADTTQLQIIALIRESDYNSIKVGSPVTITFDAYPKNKPIDGTVSAIAAYSNKESGEKEYEVAIDFPFNPSLSLPLGLEATISITP
ncbi:MAG: HlyD family efflux transporter periplasmic adaptor subunit [Clostridiales bacterium]|nr:HlyD family efflux transporter periplasmic adaptor subunit [Clostridiales bacterium]